jgi:RNA-binding protein
MALSPKQRKHLRGLSHALQPVVMVGDKGLTDSVIAEIESALDHHELIKVRLRADRDARAVLIDEIGRRCGAEIVHSIGQIACYFRRNVEKAVIELPG